VVASEHAPALGSAMHAAVAAGAHPDIGQAAAAMAQVDRDVWKPDAGRADAYDHLYELYRRLHDQFGLDPALMHELRAMRRDALA